MDHLRRLFRIGRSREIIKVEWWLMWCSFPNLNWARLRVFADGSADVFDMDGRTLNYASENEASLELVEDEFTRFCNLDEEDEQDLGVPLIQSKPPTGDSEAELLPQMYVRRLKS